MFFWKLLLSDGVFLEWRMCDADSDAKSNFPRKALANSQQKLASRVELLQILMRKLISG